MTNGLHAADGDRGGEARHRQGVGVPTPPADAHGMDHHGPGGGWGPAARSSWSPNSRGRGHRSHARPTVLRVDVLRRHPVRRPTRNPPVAHRYPGLRRRLPHSQRPATTAEIAATLRTATADRRVNHSVPTCDAPDLPTRTSAPPYALGIWLGDGTSVSASFTSADPEVALLIEAEGLVVPSLGALRYGLRSPTQGRRGTLLCRVRTGVRPGDLAGAHLWAELRRPSPVHVGTGPHAHLPGVWRTVVRTSPLPRSATRAWHRAGSTALAGGLRRQAHPAAYLQGVRGAAARVARRAPGLRWHGAADGCRAVHGDRERLARDVAELVASLGLRCSDQYEVGSGRCVESQTAYMVTFSPSRRCSASSGSVWRTRTASGPRPTSAREQYTN